MLEQRGITPTPIETRPIPEPWNLMFEGMPPADFFRLEVTLNKYYQNFNKGCLNVLWQTINGRIVLQYVEMARLTGLTPSEIAESVMAANGIVLASKSKDEAEISIQREVTRAVGNQGTGNAKIDHKIRRYVGFITLAVHTGIDNRAEVNANRVK